MTSPSKCEACHQPMAGGPLYVGGMEVDLCESCQPRPTNAKKVEGHYDDFFDEPVPSRR